VQVHTGIRVPGTNTDHAHLSTPENERETDRRCNQAAEANCSTYIQPLELVASLPLWERYETASSFANCTYHQIATRFPDIPNGVLPTLVFRDGTLVFTPRPDMSDARNFSPPPPIKPLVPLDQPRPRRSSR